MAFQFTALTALAIQNDTVLRLSRDADTWIIRGAQGSFTDGSRITDTWRVLRAHHARAEIQHDGASYRVVFCDDPYIVLFYGEEQEGEEGPSVGGPEPADTAHVTEVRVQTGINRRLYTPSAACK